MFGVAVLVVCAARAIYKVDDGDFKLHWEFGRRFLAGDFLYRGGHHLPYPPFWAMAHAPVALLPLPLAKALFFPLGVAAVAALLVVLRRLTEPAQAFWTGALALFLASRYLIRDMAELGVNTALVLLTWFAIYAWRERREGLAAVSLGAAIALKCTPAIFAAFFLWKRQWRMALLTMAAAIVFTVAPFLWQGPGWYREQVQTWLANVWQAAGSADASALGIDPLRNMSLAAALHGLPTPLVKITLLGLVAGFMWWTRAAPPRRDDPRLLWEFSAVSILMLLLSPITWGQHCVALLPACYLIASLLVSRRSLPRWAMLLIGVYVFCVLVLNRELLGRDLSHLLASYHVETFAILALLVVAMRCRSCQFDRPVSPSEDSSAQ